MRIVCLPVVEDRGLLSPVSRQLSTAPMFLLVDLATLAYRTIPNDVQRRKARGCDPCDALDDTPVDLLIAGEVEPASLEKLSRRGIPVHLGATGTAADALAAYIGGRLPGAPADPPVAAPADPPTDEPGAPGRPPVRPA